VILVIPIVAIVLVAGVVACWWSTDRVLRARRTRRVVVELKSGETFQGVLGSVDARTVVLRNVSALNGPTTVPTAVDGELLIPRGDLKFVQRP
jgi:small nuclear ribonucleoprotein (snRNP)-like protein